MQLSEKVLPDGWGRNRVWRYRLQHAPAGLPKTVIVKCSNLGGGHIFNEWANLRFLSRFDSLSKLIPDFYGGDEELELLVLEDLGAVRGQRDLGAILEGDDYGVAREALMAHSREMALLHTNTAGHEKIFNDIRARFPVYGRPEPRDRLEENFSWFQRILPQFGITTPPELAQESQAIINHIRDPKAPRAFTRGDVCPSNVAYLGQQIRFYDFEMGAFRHVLLSAAYFRVSHLACFNGSLIPLDLQAEAEQVYFQTLTPLIPDPADYQHDYAAAVTAMLIWMLSVYLEQEERPRHLATLHQRLFAALALYTQHTIFTSSFPCTAEALTQLHHKLDTQWLAAEKTILPFPAFRLA